MSIENRTCLNYSSPEFKVIAVVRASVGLITVFLGALTIITNVVSRKYLFSFHRKILYVGVAYVLDGLSSVFNRVDYLGENEATRGFCVFAGLWNKYSICAVSAASFAIACSLFMDVMYAVRANSYQAVGRRPNSCQFSDWFWPLMIFAFPLLVVWIPFLQSAYGQSPGSPWCNIRTVNEDCSMFKFGQDIDAGISALVLMYLGYVVAIYIITVLVVVRRRRRRKEVIYDHVIMVQKKQLDREIRVLFLPVIYLAARLIAIVVNLVINRPGEFIFPMWIIYAVVTSMGGFFALAMTMDCDRRSCGRVLSLCCVNSHYVKEYPVDSDPISSVEGSAMVYHAA